ncbi:serine/threonine-protein kinase [Streptoalloteichus hindustanus]|nr:serine/threonine-protein kinase [Streptoalloteichus hindustanus]
MPSDHPQPRRVAGRYRLDHVIGRGAMGTVWSAHDEILRRRVAVKEVLLPPGIPDHEADELRERTLREARAIAVLSHPNVVTLHDVVQEHGEPFVVMELLPSRSLAALVRRLGRLSTEQAAAVGDAVAAALQAAHRAGITHRDIKPGNVLVGDDGRIKLTDFGIARNVAEATLTSKGLMLGSPAYIAPEIAAGEPVTPAADLWSLGATLFTAVEGEPPYDADGNPVETVNEVVHGEVPRPTRAGPLEPVITGLMVKDPRRRISLGEARRLLHPLLPDPGAQLFEPDDGEEPATGERGTIRGVPVGFPEPAGGPPRRPPTGAPGAPGSANPSDISAAVTEPDLSAPLAADPGPLPFTPRLPTDPPTLLTPDPGPLPFPAEPAAERDAPAPLAADPGPLPFAPRSAAAEPPTVLAADPGPLPFPAPPAGRTPSRGRRRAAVLALALVLFLLAAGGGFALARMVAGRAVIPHSVRVLVQDGGGGSLDLATREDVATSTSNATGGRFSIMTPRGWQLFREASPGAPVLRYTSADGRRELAVERLTDFYPRGNVGSYLTSLRRSYERGGGAFDLRTNQALRRTDVAHGANEPPRELLYRTEERGHGRSGPAQHRSTFAHLLPQFGDLWVVRLTVPVEEETRGRTDVFDQVAGSFQVIG